MSSEEDRGSNLERHVSFCSLKGYLMLDGLDLLLWALVNVPLVVLVVLQVDENDRVWYSDVSGRAVVNGSAQQRVIVVLPLGNRVQVVVVSVTLGYGYDHE
jgi:hypothetical protein